MPAFIDLTSNKYGRLTVISRAVNSSDNRTSWLCLCDCGNKSIVRGNYLKSGKTSSCGCYQKERAKENRTKHGRSYKPPYTREIHIQRKYGLSWDAYLMMLNNQNNKCFICDYEFGAKKGDCYVDHCHKTNIVRGLLCQNCNTGLGNFRDNSERLIKAANYLAR